MSKISAEEAQEQIKLLTMMGEVGDALEEVQGYDFDDEGEPLGKDLERP
jgi:hydrogenase expression/formation protein HypC